MEVIIMQNIKIYGTILEVDRVRYNFTEFVNNSDCRLLLQVARAFDRSDKQEFCDVKKQVVEYLIKCCELRKAPRLEDIL